MSKPTKWMCSQRILRLVLVSAQSDQSLLYALSRQLRTKAFFMRTTKTLISLSGCSGWSESSLGAHAILLVLSWGGLFVLRWMDTSGTFTAILYNGDNFCDLFCVPADQALSKNMSTLKGKESDQSVNSVGESIVWSEPRCRLTEVVDTEAQW